MLTAPACGRRPPAARPRACFRARELRIRVEEHAGEARAAVPAWLVSRTRPEVIVKEGNLSVLQQPKTADRILRHWMEEQ